MDQLSGLDASFLDLESATQHGHVASVAIYAPASRDDEPPCEAILRAVRERVGAFPALRRRLVTVPFGLDRPYWIDDPSLDLGYHLRRAALPAPGTRTQLAELVARLHARPLDRTRPLWEMTVIEGLEDGRIAVYTKLHHAAVDGVAGIALTAALSDAFAGEAAKASAARRRSASVPGALAMLARGAVGRARRPRAVAREILRTASVLVRTRAVGSFATASGLLPFAHAAGAGRVPGLYRLLGLDPREGADATPAIRRTPAPRTPWNRSITPHRRFAAVTLALDDVKRVKTVFGTTVNDVVLAVTAHALRGYLAEREALPADPLIAMVPVSLRDASQANAGGNQVTMALADLATDEADPARRLLRIHRAMKSAKRLHENVPADVLQGLGQIGTGLIAGPALRLLADTGLLDRMTPPFNVAISNVPGPRQTLALGGAHMESLFPVSIVAEGQGLNVTVVSYGDALCFGLTACRDLVPDLDELARGFAEGLEILRKRADALAATVA